MTGCLSDADRTSGTDVAEARAAYTRALELAPEEPLALTGLAALEEAEGNPEAALALYEQAVAVDEDDAASALAAARLLVALGREEEAEARLDQLLRTRSYDGQAALLLAELRQRRGADVARTRELARRAARFGAGEAAAKLLEQLDAEPAPGRTVWVAGAVQRRFWSGPEGRRSRLEVVAEQVCLRDGPAGGSEASE